MCTSTPTPKIRSKVLWAMSVHLRFSEAGKGSGDETRNHVYNRQLSAGRIAASLGLAINFWGWPFHFD